MPNDIEQGMPPIDARFVAVLKIITTALDERSVTWALTGSTSFSLQGVPLAPNDIDVQTTEDGAYVFEELFSEQVVEPVSLSESDSIRSHFGAVEITGIRVEVMGNLQKRQNDGTWGPPVDVTKHRTTVDLGDIRIPVLSLRYEAEAYKQLGRTKRAALLAEYAES